MTWMKRPRRGRRARRQEKRLARAKTAQKKALGFRRIVFNRYGEWIPHWICERKVRLWNEPKAYPVAFKPRKGHKVPEDEWNAYLIDQQLKRKLDDVKMPDAYWASDRRGRRKKIPLRKITQEWMENSDLASNQFALVRSHSMPNLMDANSGTDCEALPFLYMSSDSESGHSSDLRIDQIGSTNGRYELNDYYEGRFEYYSAADDDTQIWQEFDDVEKRVRFDHAMDLRLW